MALPPLKSEYFLKAKVRHLNLADCPVTDGTTQVINALCNNPNYRVIFAPANEWGSANERPSYLGAWVCGFDVFDKRTLVSKTHGRVIRTLFDYGLIAKDKRIMTADTRAVIFDLSPAARANIRHVRRHFLQSKNARVTREKLDNLAANYGMAIHYNMQSKLFSIVTLSGKRFITKKTPTGVEYDDFIHMSPSGKPVRRLGDMTLLEWDDTLNSFSHLLP